MLQKVGMNEEALSPLRKPTIRFKFYLEYAMKAPKYDPVWQLYYPSNLWIRRFLWEPRREGDMGGVGGDGQVEVDADHDDQDDDGLEANAPSARNQKEGPARRQVLRIQLCTKRLAWISSLV
jgi:hypothetical protein